MIALRAAAGSTDPAGIVPTTLFATICSTAVAIISAKLLAPYFAAPRPSSDDAPTPSPATEEAALEAQEAVEGVQTDGTEAYPLWVSITALVTVGALVPLTVVYGREIAPWIVPGLTDMGCRLGLVEIGMEFGLQFFPDVGPKEKAGREYFDEALEQVSPSVTEDTVKYYSELGKKLRSRTRRKERRSEDDLYM